MYLFDLGCSTVMFFTFNFNSTLCIFFVNIVIAELVSAMFVQR